MWWPHDLLAYGMLRRATVLAATYLSGLPLNPWVGLGVLAAWAAAALLGGGLLLRLRDA